MFKIKDNTIHCSRGDGGTITLKIPIADAKDNIKYQDKVGNTYWYNTKSKILYNFDYSEASESIDVLNIVFYQFQVGDKITFNIYEKNGYSKEPLMKKEIIVAELSESVNISLTDKDTTFGNPVNKATIFWYDVTLNDNITVICYDEDGAKEFIEYPAKGDENNGRI